MLSNQRLKELCLVLFVLGACLSTHGASKQLQQQGLHPALAGIAPDAWQAGVICSDSLRSSRNVRSAGATALARSCSMQNLMLLKNWQYLLTDSKTWPVVTRKSGPMTFVVLSRYLKPLEANIQFAQAYCLSQGGHLAFWDTQQQYNDLAQLALTLARDTKKVWHIFVGAVQLAGSREPTEGWLWVHNSTSIHQPTFSWAEGEPNQHNSDKKGHVEDCTVIATYHGQKAKLLVDDFPCNYADGRGKYQNNGWNPQLSVACRIP